MRVDQNKKKISKNSNSFIFCLFLLLSFHCFRHQPLVFKTIIKELIFVTTKNTTFFFVVSHHSNTLLLFNCLFLFHFKKEIIRNDNFSRKLQINIKSTPNFSVQTVHFLISTFYFLANTVDTSTPNIKCSVQSGIIQKKGKKENK